MPSRRSKKDTPAKLAGRMKRRWRVVLPRAKGEILGTIEAPDVASARAAAVVQFDLDEIQRNQIMVQKLGWNARPARTTSCPIFSESNPSSEPASELGSSGRLALNPVLTLQLRAAQRGQW